MPYSEYATLGEVMCSGWDYFINTNIEGKTNSNQLAVNEISDLVLKTIEAQQFRERLSDVK